MDNNYFFDLGTTLLTEEEKKSVINLAEKNLTNFIPYQSMADGAVDGNEFLPANFLLSSKEVWKLLKNCKIQCFPMIIKHAPGTEVLRHIDDPNKRNTVISIPLCPVDYSPTYFWESISSTEPKATATFPNMNACLLNTQAIHNLVNQSKTVRLNLQLCFKEPFVQIKNKILNKEFWIS